MAEIPSIISQNKREPVPLSSELGTRGEALAADLIRREGYRIVMANFKAPIGRNSKGVQVTGEIDLIALDGETLCFIEVKTRRSEDFGGPISAVDLRKQRQINRTARVYKRLFRLTDVKHRYDVVSILMKKGMEPQIELHRGFWSEEKFKKPSWNHEIW